MKNVLKIIIVLLSSMGYYTAAMEQGEVWYGQDLPVYHETIARDSEGYKAVVLTGPDQNGYFVRLIYILEGPRQGSILVDSDDFGYEDRRTDALDKALFQYLQQKYLEQNIPEKG
jgi:ABC-type arginine transport system ATPase subunit